MRFNAIFLRAIFFHVVLVMLLLAGCRSHKKPVPRTAPPAPQPASPQTIQMLRQSYLAAYPHSRLGPVTAVLPDYHLAAVDEIAAQGVAENEVVTFMDGSQRVLTTGRIVRILPEFNRVHVRYDPPASGGRAPRPGDIMLRF